MRRIVLVVAMISSHASVSVTAQTQWVSKGIGGGGAVYTISISPYNGNELFLACDMSDVFHSTDFGVSWTTIPYQQLVGFHHAAVRFTNNAQILYTLKNTTCGYAPMRSNDGGTNWFAIINPAIASGGYKCYQLFAHPQRNDVVIVSDRFNLYISHNGGSTFSSPFSTDNASKGMHLVVFTNNTQPQQPNEKNYY